jgi:formylglycine-generating enzyme required for sulfatase activity
MHKSVLSLCLVLTAAVLLCCSCSKDDGNPAVTTGNATITISVPNGGEVWPLGENKIVSWTSSNVSGTVTIQLNRSYPGGSWEVLAASAVNSGSFNWIVAGAPTSAARIRILTVSGAEAVDTSNASFTIADTSSLFVPAGMVRIAAAGRSFQMGSATGLSDEQPVHQVTFAGDFWLDSTEVTQGRYDALMLQSYAAYLTPSWHAPYGVGAQYPAYAVYWSDAVLYCNARSRRDGLDSVYSYSAIRGTPGNLCELDNVSADLSKNGYRLPTEAQWEFACRGGVSADYSWNRQYDPYPATAADSVELGQHAVWFANAWIYGADSASFGTHAVASKTANPYGLFDMTGNLYEWCHDWYGEYSVGAVTDPSGPVSGDWHCLRGGSWGSHANYLRASNRTFTVPDYLYYFIGFRVALPVPSTQL